jgi:Prokaryotic phospholipase A2
MAGSRFIFAGGVSVLSMLVSLGFAGAAQAVPVERKLALMSQWTQPTQRSFNRWNAARQDRSLFARYGFDWSTDYCTGVPSEPFGWDFRLPCWHHDWGYRNYRAAGLLTLANKARIDSVFYFNMRHVCAGYVGRPRVSCDDLAKVYYDAVRTFGGLLDRLRELARATRTDAQWRAATVDRPGRSLVGVEHRAKEPAVGFMTVGIG